MKGERVVLGRRLMCTPDVIREDFGQIDRLAEEGALFERAFHTTPICSPNRASIVTGQYAIVAFLALDLNQGAGLTLAEGSIRSPWRPAPRAARRGPPPTPGATVRPSRP